MDPMQTARRDCFCGGSRLLRLIKVIALPRRLEGLDALGRENFQGSFLLQPALLAKMAERFGHRDPRHAGHLGQLSVGEIHRFKR